jgi:hypothetical protein
LPGASGVSRLGGRYLVELPGASGVSRLGGRYLVELPGASGVSRLGGRYLVELPGGTRFPWKATESRDEWKASGRRSDG